MSADSPQQELRERPMSHRQEKGQLNWTFSYKMAFNTREKGREVNFALLDLQFKRLVWPSIKMAYSCGMMIHSDDEMTVPLEKRYKAARWE